MVGFSKQESLKNEREDGNQNPMTKQPKSFTPQEKSQVALAAIKGEKTLAQISSDYRVHPTQIGLWKKQAIDYLPEAFKDNRRKEKLKEAEYQEQLDNLYRIVGQKDIELDWLKKNCQSFTQDERKRLIERDATLTLSRQCELLSILRSSLYYEPIEMSEHDKKTMDLIDEIYTAHPFYGNRRIKAELNETHRIPVGRDKVQNA